MKVENEVDVAKHEGHEVKMHCISSTKQWRGRNADWLNKVYLFCETCKEEVGKPWEERSPAEYEVTLIK